MENNKIFNQICIMLDLDKLNEIERFFGNKQGISIVMIKKWRYLREPLSAEKLTFMLDNLLERKENRQIKVNAY